MAVEVQLELIVGRVVHDTNGTPVGRIEDVRAALHDGELLVNEFVLGTHGLLERMALSFSSIFVNVRRRERVVPWRLMDLSDAERPRTRCAVEDLDKNEA